MKGICQTRGFASLFHVAFIWLESSRQSISGHAPSVLFKVCAPKNKCCAFVPGKVQKTPVCTCHIDAMRKISQVNFDNESNSSNIHTSRNSNNNDRNIAVVIRIECWGEHAVQVAMWEERGAVTSAIVYGMI